MAGTIPKLGQDGALLLAGVEAEFSQAGPQRLTAGLVLCTLWQREGVDTCPSWREAAPGPCVPASGGRRSTGRGTDMERVRVEVNAQPSAM